MHGGTLQVGHTLTFTIPKYDDIPPSEPGSVRAYLAFGGFLNILWSASNDRYGIKNYIIEEKFAEYSNWHYLRSTTDTLIITFFSAYPGAWEPRYFRIKAVDLAGNESSYTPALYVEYRCLYGVYPTSCRIDTSYIIEPPQPPVLASPPNGSTT